MKKQRDNRPEDTEIPLGGGVHQRGHVTRVPEGYVRRAINVVPSGGGMRRRQGFSQLFAGTEVTSLWANGESALYTDSGTLYLVDELGARTVLATGVLPPVSYCEIGGQVYVSSRTQNIRVQDGVAKPWTPTMPSGLGSAAFTVPGTLPQAKYTCAMVYVDSSGLEGPALELPLEGAGAIALAGLVTPADHLLRIYLSEPDTDALYHVQDYAAGVTSVTISSRATGMPMLNRFAEEMPAGAERLTEHNGRLYAVYGDTVFASDPLQYGLTHLDDSFMVFSAPVTNIGGTEGALFITHGRSTLTLKGATFGELSRQVHTVPPAIPGSMVPVRPSLLGLEVPVETAVAWMTESGPAVGLPDGSVKLLTDKQLQLSTAESAAMVVSEQEGERQLLAIVKNPQPNLAVASDLLESVIIRNGQIVI